MISEEEKYVPVKYSNVMVVNTQRKVKRIVIFIVIEKRGINSWKIKAFCFVCPRKNFLVSFFFFSYFGSNFMGHYGVT